MLKKAPSKPRDVHCACRMILDTEFLQAVYTGNFVAVLEHLFLNPDDVNVKNEDGITPLMIACNLRSKAALAMIELLLLLGADVTMQSKHNMRAVDYQNATFHVQGRCKHCRRRVPLSVALPVPENVQQQLSSLCANKSIYEPSRKRRLWTNLIGEVCAEARCLDAVPNQ